MTPANRNRFIAVVALAAAGTGLALVAFGNMGENLVYYWSPGEMVAQGDKAYGATVRLGGVVQKGSLDWNSQKTQLAFRVSDDHKPDAPSVRVVSSEVPPQMFREGIGVVVEGVYDKSGTFTSNRLMVNHSNEYRPPKEGEQHKNHDWKETVAGDQTASARKE